MSETKVEKKVDRSLTDDTDDKESDHGRVVTNIILDLSVGVYAEDRTNLEVSDPNWAV
jgi:hypothetical protein